jgi:hypothetical protein
MAIDSNHVKGKRRAQVMFSLLGHAVVFCSGPPFAACERQQLSTHLVV